MTTPQNRQLVLALVVEEDDPLHDLLVLIMSTLSRYCTYHQYPHASHVEWSLNYDALIVKESAAIRRITEAYRGLGRPAPPIIHVADPEDPPLDYEKLFPAVNITRIIQGSTQDIGTTLKFDNFYQAIRQLRHNLPEQVPLPPSSTAEE